MSYETVLVERRGAVTVVTLNRPQALNALNSQVLKDITEVFADYDADPDQRCLVLTGSEKAFAAGADIKEMSDKSYAQMFASDFFGPAARRLEQFRKPIIAAVAGYALGGGCELAMLCDFIIAAETAKFGQPEINLGVIPGAGGTQRLTRFVGKSKAMDMVLTARMMNAEEANQCGLVSRVVPLADLISTAMEAAQKIAALSPNSVMIAKELVNAAYETPLSQGVKMERRLFHSLFAFDDHKEGMAAFVEKRPAKFTGK